MSFRDLVLNNFRWKLTALVLAMLIWFVIKLAIYKGITGGQYQILHRQPVMVLKAPDDSRIFRIDPPYADVVVQASKELSGDDVELYLNLTTMPDVNSALKQVLVRGAEGTKVIRVEPAFILAERATSADSLTNSLRKP
jgi:hypothetical protein